MSATRSLLRWVAPLARWTGLDTNPLRRGSDRAEAWIRLSLILAFLIGSPVTAGAVGEWAHAESVSAARAEAASEHRVPAVLLHVATLGDGYPVRQTKRMSWVKARWTAPDGSPRSRLP